MATLDAIGYSTESASWSEQREQLILENLPQVNWIAARIHEKLPGGVALEDLISVGIIGLISAIDNFDPARNAQLKTYAEYKIRGAILDSVRGLDGIPAHKRKRLKMVQAAMSALEQRLHRAPTEEEISKELGIDLGEYRDWLLDLRGITVGSLDAPMTGDGSSLLTYLFDRDSQSPAELLERNELEKLIEDGIQHLPENERLVLDLYYRQELNMREIASILHLHITRISQLRAQAVLRLRTSIAKRWPTGKGIF